MSAGDGVLRSVAQVLRDQLPRVMTSRDVTAAKSSASFLPETKVGNTTVVADGFGSGWQRAPLTSASDSVVVTASIGIAGIDSAEDEGTLSPSTLIDRADALSTPRKHLGRNRVELWGRSMQGSAMGTRLVGVAAATNGDEIRVHES